MVAETRHAVRTPSLQPPGVSAFLFSAGKSFIRSYPYILRVSNTQSGRLQLTAACSQGHLLRGGLLRPCLALTKQRALLPVSRARRLVRLAQCLDYATSLAGCPPTTAAHAQVVHNAGLCNAEGCDRRSVYNFEGERPLVCGHHRAEGMASPRLCSLCTAHLWLAGIIVGKSAPCCMKAGHVCRPCVSSSAPQHCKVHANGSRPRGPVCRGVRALQTVEPFIVVRLQHLCLFAGEHCLQTLPGARVQETTLFRVPRRTGSVLCGAQVR